jgi:CBS domain-containing protein
VIRPGPARPLVSATALSATTVGAVMHPGVVACTPETPLAEVARMMADLRMHCIAVIGGRAPSRRPRAPPLGTRERHRRSARRPPRRAGGSGVGGGRDAPLALPEPAGLDRAAALMTEHDATHVVAVGRSGMPSGVLLTLDVLRIVAAG